MTSAQFLEFIVSASLQAAIIVCITYGLCRFVEAPRLQCRLWNSCHGLIVLVVILGLVLPHWRAASPWQSIPPQILEQVVVSQAFVGSIAFATWIGGTSAALVLLVREWARAFQFLRLCRIANDEETAIVTQLAGGSLVVPGGKSSRPVQLLLSNGIGSPFCCQWHQPQLVIPEFMLELHPEAIRLVVRHELEHLNCGHPLQLFIERLVATVFWFHPAIWWASRQSSLAREYTCDDAAVTERQEIVSYLKSLVAIAERGLSEEAVGATLFFGRGAGIMALRGRRLLSRVERQVPPENSKRPAWVHAMLPTLAIGAWFVWVPLDALGSAHTNWSPWPQWSANVLRTFEIPARDFEPYEFGTRRHELSSGWKTSPDS